MSDKVVVNLRLDKALVGRVDAAGGPRGRTKLIVAALEAFLAPKPAVDPRPVPSVDPRRPQFVRARTLVSPTEFQQEWAEIMANRQARLNKKRDDAA